MRLLILGTGGMANAHARAFGTIRGVKLVAAAETEPERLSRFCKNYGIEHAFASLDEALAWGQFDAIANVTPDPVHHATTMQALAAGKHVFCEKPLAVTVPDAEEMVAAQKASGLIGMVNLTYRNFAPLQKARKMIAEGQLGTIRHIEASYLQSWLTQDMWGKWDEDPTWLWRLSTAHGSNGALGDVGIHVLDFASYAIGQDIAEVACRLKTFDKAEGGRIGDYVLDANDAFTMQVGFDGGAMGVVHASRWASGHINDLKLRAYGEKGGIEVGISGPDSWLKVSTGTAMRKGEWRQVAAAKVPTNYRKFADAVAAGQQDEPSFARAAQLQKVLAAAMAADTSGCLERV